MATPSRSSIAHRTPRRFASSSATLAARNLIRAERMAGSLCFANAPWDKTSSASTVSASDRRARSRRSATLVIVRPRSATSSEDRMFSSAFSTRRNAAIACTSGSFGSALMSIGMSVGTRLFLNASEP